MGRIEADIALESWLFRFWPCLGPGQFTLIHFLVFIKLKYATSLMYKFC